MSNNNAKELLRTIADENISLFEDGIGAGEFSGFLNTGSLALNAAFSGSIFGRNC